jgi:anaerobic selenocysteine-containing dehydrogenase
MITENLVDQPFLDKYCVGYDEKTLPADAPANGHYKAYILGQGSDGMPKRRSGHRRSPVFRRAYCAAGT